jgi:phosphate transport system protein
MELRHTDREYEAELRSLRENVLLMGARTEDLLKLAMRAFTERDSELARQTMRSDRQFFHIDLVL